MEFGSGAHLINKDQESKEYELAENDQPLTMQKNKTEALA
jgi:hypothetical protein